MKQLSRVLAAVDFSTPARRAFEYALAISQKHGAELVVVQAVPPNQPLSWQARARLALTGKLQHIARQAKVKFKHRIQHGDPAETIVLHARSLGPDVIVIGTHQRTGIDRLRAGSVADRVAAKAAMPVLLVPQGGETTTIRPFSHVAVAVDFSPSSDRAVEEALALASEPGDRVTLLHVVPGSSSGVPRHLYRYGAAEYQDHLVRDARRRLQLAVPVNRQPAAAVHTRVLVGDTATEIGRAVDSIGADLLVVGVPYRGIVRRALFGSTARRVLRAIRIPMLAVPEAGAASADERGASLAVAA